VEVLIAALDSHRNGMQPTAKLVIRYAASEAVTAMAVPQALMGAPALSPYLARPDLRTRTRVLLNCASAF